MDRAETLTILSVLKAAYPSFYKDMDRSEADGIVNLWTEMFKNDNPALVGYAVKALISCDGKGFPPHIGAIKEYMRKLTDDRNMTEAEAWNLVSKAIRNGIYGSVKEFEKLPPDIQSVVGSPNQLREWAMMDEDTVQSVVSSNFQRSYKVIAKRQEELRALPPDVRNLISRITSGAENGNGNLMLLSGDSEGG